ncbi:MAG: phosphatase PAP2 family protein [Parcubacteria group bacterium CG10_big_fil_rev_8_21_14_0_10_36_14]|nr:MAG: phosphatase PAP2 family protein [Parcubacteria group bacterium CG10_big_fil_rev_8_21_14_0_10_36_14]
MDIQILKFLNNFAGQNLYLDAIFIFFAVYFPIVFALSHFLFFIKNKKIALLLWIWILAVFGLLIKEVISLFYFRVRPFEVVDGINKLIDKSAGDASFPSGHTLVAFVLAFSVFWLDKKWGIVFILSALFIAFARIFVGVHYPTDILGGMVIAFALSFVLRKKS